MSEQKGINVFQPLIYMALIAAGVIAGRYLNNSFSGNNNFSMMNGNDDSRKITDVLNYIKLEYVDSVDEKKLVNGSIEKLLEQLDPHSAYIPAEDFSQANEPLEGNFDGIGIEFHIQQDSVMVVAVIPGGPSSEVGLMAGDRIIKVDEKKFTGKEIDNKVVMKNLRGPGGSKVKVTVWRRTQSKPLDFTITRGKIPINSLEAAYMVNDITGYIRLSRFAATTFDEYQKAFNELSKKGMKQLILDLRGNPGGYMEAAVALSDEFLPGGKMIVYTKGKSRPKQEYKATATGNFESGRLIVLIDEGSASASEIVAGALQDYDRATIIGRRSFGKGLVQEQVELPDGSAIRLTVSRYYTPSGRSIQKPYSDGVEAYQHELMQRYQNGEFENADSIRFADSLKYKTQSGRTVYGGGGIMPDVFVPADTSFRSAYYEHVIAAGLVMQFAYDYVDENRKTLSAYSSVEDFSVKLTDEQLLSEFVSYSYAKGIKPQSNDLERCRHDLSNLLKAYVARQLYRDNGFYKIYLQNDSAFQRALEILKSKSTALK